MYGILFNIIIFCVWNYVYNIFNFVVVVSLVLIKNAFRIIKTKQHKKKKYETLTKSPKKLHFCRQYLLTFHQKVT
jgi:hypothetical protein